MAVYVVKKNNPWGYLGANLGNGLFDNIIGGMFARDAQARQVRRSRGLWDDASRTMKAQPGLPQPEAPRPQYSEDVQSLANSAMRGMPTATDNQGWKGLWDSTVGLGKEYRPGREELLGVFGRHGVTPQEAELLMNYYKNQFETADKLGYQDNIASRVGGLDYDVRRNAPNAARSAAVAGAYGIDMAPEEAYKYEGMRGVETIKLLARRQWGRELTDDEAAAMYEKKAEAFRACPKAEKMDGVEELMRKIKADGLKIVVVTGSGQNILLKRLEEEFSGLVNANLIVTSFDVEHGKPDPEPYLRGLEKAGIKPGEGIVVENAPLGVRAAVAAGIFTIAVNTGPLPDKELADEGANLVFPKMTALRDAWETLLSAARSRA